MTLDRFYPIFDSSEWLEQLLPRGIKLVQLRIKDKPPAELKNEIARSQELANEHGTVMVVNDYWQLAIELGCDWVHLGQEDLDTANVNTIKDAGLKIGISTHDEAELDRALKLNPDYVALGPIYPTRLKKMKWHQQGLERLTEWRQAIGEIPLVAIGGFNVERAPAAFEHGADVVSVVTDITLNEKPAARVNEWITVTRADNNQHN